VTSTAVSTGGESSLWLLDARNIWIKVNKILCLADKICYDKNKNANGKWKIPLLIYILFSIPGTEEERYGG
jgi:hypothetical protein